MLCTYCQVQVRGTGCQSQSQANQCANNRERESEDWDDHVSGILKVSSSFLSAVEKEPVTS